MVEALADSGEVVRVPLTQRFQDLIDAVAMREDASDSEAYLEGWGQSAELERPGDATEVGRQVADELEAGFTALIAARWAPPRG